MRLFFAICFPEEVKDRLAETVFDLSRQASGNFTRRENLHLTLAFLGETPRLRAAQEALSALRSSPFSLSTGELGQFRRAGGDIYWLGFASCPALSAVQEQLAGALKDAGFALEDRPFTPHLTLGRKVRPNPGFDREKFNRSLPELIIPVRKISLMESLCEGGKPAYQEVSTVELKERA